MHWIGIGVLIFIGFAIAPYLIGIVLGIGFGLMRLLLLILPGIIGGVTGYWIAPDASNPLLVIGGGVLPYMLYLCRIPVLSVVEPILTAIEPVLTAIERIIDRASWVGFVGGTFVGVFVIMGNADLVWDKPREHGGTLLALFIASLILGSYVPYMIGAIVARMRAASDRRERQ